MRQSRFKDLLMAGGLMLLWWFLAMAMVAGCGQPESAKGQSQQAVTAALAEKQLEHERELHQAKTAAAAEIEAANARVIEAQLEARNARGADFDAGVAAGKAMAQAAFDAKLELARVQEFDRGRLLGAAEAESAAIEKGRMIGEEIGQLKGRDEAEKDFESQLQAAIERTKTDTHNDAFLKGLREGELLAERTGRLESSIIGICLASVLIPVGCYVLIRRHQRQPAEIYEVVSQPTCGSIVSNGSPRPTLSVRRLINASGADGLDIQNPPDLGNGGQD